MRSQGIIQLVFAFLILFVTSFFVVYYFPMSARYKIGEIAQLISFFISYFFTALLLELFSESTIGLYFKFLAARLEIVKNEKGRLLEDYYTSEESQTDLQKEKMLKTDHAIAQEQLNNFKHMQPVYYLGILFFVGLLLAFSGLRMLSYFIETSDLHAVQSSLFRTIDVIVSAGALSGGALAIQRIGSSVLDYKQKLSAKSVKS